jgi:hypothetical protein
MPRITKNIPRSSRRRRRKRRDRRRRTRRRKKRRRRRRRRRKVALKGTLSSKPAVNMNIITGILECVRTYESSHEVGPYQDLTRTLLVIKTLLGLEGAVGRYLMRTSA